MAQAWNVECINEEVRWFETSVCAEAEFHSGSKMKAKERNWGLKQTKSY